MNIKEFNECTEEYNTWRKRQEEKIKTEIIKKALKLEAIDRAEEIAQNAHVENVSRETLLESTREAYHGGHCMSNYFTNIRVLTKDDQITSLENKLKSLSHQIETLQESYILIEREVDKLKESKESKQKVRKTCSTCQYGGIPVSNEPCQYCKLIGNSFTHWRAQSCFKCKHFLVEEQECDNCKSHSNFICK